MRHVVRGDEPVEFTIWKMLENDDWQPTYASLHNPEKALVRDALRQEQLGLCGYCGGRLDGLVEEHIDHVCPQSAPEGTDRTLDYDNFVLSCGGETGEPPPSHRHCGHARADWYDVDRFVHPLDPRCEAAFLYDRNGRVRPGGPVPGMAADAADVSVVRLNLDCARLRARRKAVLDGWLDGTETWSREALEELATKVESPTPEGNLAEYAFVVAHHVRGLLA
jgi:uncharacterized protein (TIGR02646 family)